jgi:cardiolipin synthase A/B
MFNSKKLSTIFLLFAACTGVCACATLPDVSNLKESLDQNAKPTVTNSYGTLGDKKADALLSTRWRNTKIDLKKMAALEEQATGIPLIAGNKVTLLYDGPQTMDAMLAAIADAKDHINLETYIFDQDPLGLRFANLLIAKQRSGIQVNIIYDSVGTIGTPSEFFKRMQDAGIRLIAFNPVNPLTQSGRWQLNNRDHRKILIVDGKIAFTGGINISATYASNSLFRSRTRIGNHAGWRDTHIRIEGPAVAAMQWIFLDNWTSRQTEELAERAYFPPLMEAGNKFVRILASAPDSDDDIYKAYILAIQEARKSVYITSAYFVPDPQIIDALTKAVKRGVDVKLILPGVSDSGLVFHASQSFYSQLLAVGIKIYQLQISVLHAKTAVIDGVWSTVGSTNIDIRSFLHNYEVNVIVLDEAFGHDMESAFQEDLRHSLEITEQTWAQRPFINRIKEWVARTFKYWL